MDSGVSEPLMMRVESIEARKMPGFSKDSRRTTSILKRSSKIERDEDIAYTHGQASVGLLHSKHNHQTPKDTTNSSNDLITSFLINT